MHHTDYSNNLRKAQHKTIKNLSLNQHDEQNNRTNNPELVPAILAIGMVILALFQMDPANADTAAMTTDPMPPVEQPQDPAEANEICATPHPFTSILINDPKTCPQQDKDQQMRQTTNGIEAVVSTFQFATPTYPVTVRLPL